ncbi:MAG: hypothetical protein Q4D38_11750 [Planctomycetia bacterium]|nr:hypothetical protein [Planctomycetia bacterium]
MNQAKKQGGPIVYFRPDNSDAGAFADTACELGLNPTAVANLGGVLGSIAQFQAIGVPLIRVEPGIIYEFTKVQEGWWITKDGQYWSFASSRWSCAPYGVVGSWARHKPKFESDEGFNKVPGLQGARIFNCLDDALLVEEAWTNDGIANFVFPKRADVTDLPFFATLHNVPTEIYSNTFNENKKWCFSMLKLLDKVCEAKCIIYPTVTLRQYFARGKKLQRS